MPEAGGYLQQMKVGGKEDEGLVVQEIVSYFLDNPELYAEKAVVIGPGSTCLAIKQALGLNGTLLGCDVMLPDGEAIENATSAQLQRIAEQQLTHVLVSFTRHQGFLLGRGNPATWSGCAARAELGARRYCDGIPHQAGYLGTAPVVSRYRG